MTNRTYTTLTLTLALALPLRAQQGDPTPPTPAGVESKAEIDAPPVVTIDYFAWLPGSVDPKLQGEFDVEFRIYASPQGGQPLWSERRVVRVVNGRMRVALGEVVPVPMSLHEATFKFLGASVAGAAEVYPRSAIVNVVYVSPEEALLAAADRPRANDGAERAAAEREYDEVAQRAWRVAPETQVAATWKEALRAARKAGADLPGYEDWYRALRVAERAQVLERAGHYEFVRPWVYDTASHGELNRYFRGRFQGCDYMDLSPEKRYPYRLARRIVAPAPETAAQPVPAPNESAKRGSEEKGQR